MSTLCALVIRRLRNLAYLVLPPLEVTAARKILLRKSAEPLEQLEKADVRYAGWYAINVVKLDQLIHTESDRATKLDDKAAKITAVLAIGLTIGGSFAKSVVDNMSTQDLRFSVEIGLVLSMIYLILGAWIGFRSGIAAKRRSGYGPDWEADLSKDKSDARQPRVQALIDFEIANLIRSNDIDGALGCVRNGLVIFSLVMLLAVADPLIPLLGRLAVLAKLWLHSPTGGGPVQCPRFWV